MESWVEYDNSEESAVINISYGDSEITDDSMKTEENPSQEFLALQPLPPSDLETSMSYTEIPLTNQDIIFSNDVPYDFLIQDTEADAVTQEPVVLTYLGTPAVVTTDELISYNIPLADNTLSIEESLQQLISEVNTTTNQEVGGSVSLVEQNTMNQRVKENDSGVVQSTMNHQMMENISLVAQNTTNRQVKEHAETVQNTNSKDENMASTLKPYTPKKRGRKPKERRTLPKKIKLYEMDAFADAEKERRRLNAINARKHRALAKEKQDKMENMLQTVIKERDRLRKEVKQYKKREEALLKQLGDYEIEMVN